MERPQKTVELFWTGGYDSTFRMVQLSKLPVRVQPYYLSDNRRTENEELSAIEKITAILKSKPDTRCTLLKPIIIPTQERPRDADVSRAFRSLLASGLKGDQYEWLAVFAKAHPGVELSVHQDDKAVLFLQTCGAVREEQDPDTGGYFVIDRTRARPEVTAVFGAFHFPLLTYTKVGMQEEYTRLGCEDIVPLTWFCYAPIGEKPCGLCKPCQFTIEEGLAWRCSSGARRRYRWRGVYLLARRFKNALKKYGWGVFKKGFGKAFGRTAMTPGK